MSDSDDGPISNEGLLLEMSNQLKLKFQQNENEIKKIRKEYNELKKGYMKLYGIIFMLSDLSIEVLDIPIEMLNIIEFLNATINSQVDHILTIQI